jgi:hypothetical protein
MRGASSPHVKLTSDFANTSEAIRIGDCFLFDSFAKNSSLCNFQLLQHYLPTRDMILTAAHTCEPFQAGGCGSLGQLAHNSAKQIKTREQAYPYSKTRLGQSQRVVLWILPVDYVPCAKLAGANCAPR